MFSLNFKSKTQNQNDVWTFSEKWFGRWKKWTQKLQRKERGRKKMVERTLNVKVNRIRTGRWHAACTIRQPHTLSGNIQHPDNRSKSKLNTFRGWESLKYLSAVHNGVYKNSMFVAVLNYLPLSLSIFLFSLRKAWAFLLFCGQVSVAFYSLNQPKSIANGSEFLTKSEGTTLIRMKRNRTGRESDNVSCGWSSHIVWQSLQQQQSRHQ